MLHGARSARSQWSPSRERSHVASLIKKPLERDSDIIYWRSATLGVLFSATVLAALVALMHIQVGKLSKQVVEYRDAMHLQLLTLTEILRQLQIGKALNCSVCKSRWVQRKDSCYLFREREMGWHLSRGFCRDEFSSLAVIHNNTEQMDFLRFESTKHFRSHHGQDQYGKFWMGLMYDIVTKQWKWADGALYYPEMHGELRPKGCAYLQNGSLFSQECDELAYVLCRTEVRFGWS